ncbi:MAG: PIG-L family deacetylase [Actinobacteria bacterium]|nr:PIG-L family deacetylase [Actinomycetota bacterium]
MVTTLPSVRAALAVCAHPDDESFGLGAILAALAERTTAVRTLCFTHGEASTLGNTCRPLGEVRTEELRAAAEVLGIEDVAVCSYSDGHLGEVPVETLAEMVEQVLGDAELLIVFDQGGITSHPDHCQATQAALTAARRHDLPVLAWTLPEQVAVELNAEHGTSFVGRSPSEVDIVAEVDRNRQLSAIACHASQSGDNPVMWHRLELLGDKEYLRWLWLPWLGREKYSTRSSP